LRLRLGPTVTVHATDACAIKSTASGWLKEHGKNLATYAPSKRSSAPSQGEFGSATGRFGVEEVE